MRPWKNIAEKWTEPGNIVTNGPYTLEKWTHGSEMRYVKNPLWPGADNVQIEVIQGPDHRVRIHGHVHV